MLKFKKIKTYLVIMCFALLTPFLVGAAPSDVIDQPGSFFDTVFTNADLKEESTPEAVATRVGTIINQVLIFLGLIILAVVLYAGFMWITAGGDSGKVAKARELLMNAAIGAVVIGAAYGISAAILVLSA